MITIKNNELKVEITEDGAELRSIVFKGKESKHLTGSDNDVESLVKELLDSHTIG